MSIVIVALALWLFAVAVTTTDDLFRFWFGPTAVAVNVAVEAFAGTVTVAGTVSRPVLEEDKLTVVAADRVAFMVILTLVDSPGKRA